MPQTENHNYYLPLNIISLGIGCLILWYTPICEFASHVANDTLSSLLQLAYSGIYLLILSIVLQRRFPVKSYLPAYLVGVAVNTGIFITAFLSSGGSWITVGHNYVIWLYLVFIFTHIFLSSKTYYTIVPYKDSKSIQYTIALNIAVSICLLAGTWLFLHQISLGKEFRAGFSICLAIIGFIQMNVGMRLHFKLLRIISLFTFGLILLKLVLLDIWQLPTIGKIIVFILLGVVLLVLSFMYQKLKNVLFKDHPNES